MQKAHFEEKATVGSGHRRKLTGRIISITSHTKNTFSLPSTEAQNRPEYISVTTDAVSSRIYLYGQMAFWQWFILIPKA